jgi:hypothetical protein
MSVESEALAFNIRIGAVLVDFGGFLLCLILQPSKQNLVFNLYGRRERDFFSKPPSQDFHLRVSFKSETRRLGALNWRLNRRGYGLARHGLPINMYGHVGR